MTEVAASSKLPPPFRTRTDVLFATRAPLAVILRRGPRTHWQLILWDTRRDTFTPGQWMKGLVRLMDLSPRGDKLIYWAAQYHASARWLRRQGHAPEHGGYDPLTVDHFEMRRIMKRYRHRKPPRYLTGPQPRRTAREVQGVWTAISTPPYFTALAIWPSFGHWTGGGFFLNDHRIVLYEGECGLAPIANTPIPSTFSISPWDTAASLRPPPETLAYNPRRQITERQIEIELALKDAGARFVDWTCTTPEGGALFACDGSIYRLESLPPAPGPEILTAAKRLVDLSANRFELVRAPTPALRW